MTTCLGDDSIKLLWQQRPPRFLDYRQRQENALHLTLPPQT